MKKLIYGLKQAPVKFNKKLTTFLKKERMTQLKTEQYIFKSEFNSLILEIYVDDGIIIGQNHK